MASAAQLEANRVKTQARQEDLLRNLDCFANSELYQGLDQLVSAALQALKSNPLIAVWPPPPGRRDPGQEVAANVMFGVMAAAIAAGGIFGGQVWLVTAAPGMAAFIVDQGGVLFGGMSGGMLPFEATVKAEIRKAFSENRKQAIVKALSQKLGRAPTVAEVKELCKAKWASEDDLKKAVAEMKAPKVLDSTINLAANRLLGQKRDALTRQAMAASQDVKIEVEGQWIDGVWQKPPEEKKGGLGALLIFAPLLLLL